MSSGRKAAGYLQSLQQALKHERFSEVPELSRKVRKHDPARTCFARSAEAQALLVKRLRTEQKRIDSINFNDAQDKFHWAAFPVEQLGQEKSLLDEAYQAHQTASAEDKAYYDLTNFLYGLMSGQIEAASTLISQIPTHPHNPYLSQSCALRGVLQELQGNRQNAVREYESFSHTNLESSSLECTFWLELIRYRLAILSPSTNSIQNFQKYHTQLQNSSNVRLLHVLSKEDDGDHDAFGKELLNVTRFPAAESTNTRLLSFVSSKLDPWISAGSDPLIAEQHLDLLYEAGSKTFHSPRILRYLVHVLTALQRHDEALLALNAYLQIAFHARKTDPGGDVDAVVDIVSTARFATTHLLKHVSIDLQPRLKAQDLTSRISKILLDLDSTDKSFSFQIEEMHGSTKLLDYYASSDPFALRNAIDVLSSPSTNPKSNTCLCTLAVAQAENDDLTGAMTSVHSVVQGPDAPSMGFIVFANLLCSQELFDRALVALEYISSSLWPSKTQHSFKDGVESMTAKIMELKVIERRDGPEVALRKSSELFSDFRKYLGTITPDTTIMNGSKAAVNGNSVSIPQEKFPDHDLPQAPSITIQAPVENRAPAFLAPEMSSVAPHERSQITNGTEPRHAPTANHENQRSASGPARTSSLKASQPSRHLGNHLNMRKSASVRSMRGRDSTANSSRSSSPLNHPAPSMHSILPDTAATTPHHAAEDEFELDRQLTAVESQDKKRREVLAEIWMYVAHLCRATKTLHAETEQAIAEAIALIGTTPDIMSKQLEIRLEFARTQDAVLSREEFNAIEQGYDYALQLDDQDAVTILSFSQFLLDAAKSIHSGMKHNDHGEYDDDDDDDEDSRTQLRNDRLARAYEMLESLKSSPAVENPELWFLSAEVALERGEAERAEEEYWRAVQKSDAAGVIEWHRIWKLL